MGGRTWLRGSFFQDFLWSRLAYCRSGGEGFLGRGGGGVELLSLLELVVVAVLEALGCSENGVDCEASVLLGFALVFDSFQEKLDRASVDYKHLFSTAEPLSIVVNLLLVGGDGPLAVVVEGGRFLGWAEGGG